MYISDYMYASLPMYWSLLINNYNNEKIKTNNWMYMGLWEWTISRASYSATVASRIYEDGQIGTGSVYYVSGIRPSFYITSDAKIKEGEGSKEIPYRITF